MRAKRSTKNHGYSLLEIVLALAIASIIIASFTGLIMNTIDIESDTSVRSNAVRIGTGILQAGQYYIQMIANKCTLPSTNAYWGWHICAGNGYPYPSVSGNNIVYTLPSEGNGLVNADINNLKSYIKSVFAVCSASEAGNVLTLSCNRNMFLLHKITYTVYDATEIDATNVDSSTFFVTVSSVKYLNYTKLPVSIKLEFDVSGGMQYRDTNGLVFHNDFVLKERENETLLRYNTVIKSLRTYAVNRFFTEVSSNITGLKSPSALNVPWIWQVLGHGVGVDIYRKCTLSGNNCDYTTSGATIEWSGAIANAEYTLWHRIKSNLNLEDKYTIDGFGNPAHIIPLTTPCSLASPGVNIMNCDINTVFNNSNYLPSIPAKNYVYNTFYNAKPPYSAAIFNRLCLSVSSVPSHLCMLVDVYPN